MLLRMRKRGGGVIFHGVILAEFDDSHVPPTKTHNITSNRYPCVMVLRAEFASLFRIHNKTSPTTMPCPWLIQRLP